MELDQLLGRRALRTGGLIGMRLFFLIALALACVVGACGGDSSPKPAPGSPENPLEAQLPESAAGSAQPGARVNEAQAPAGHREGEQPGYAELVERQTAKPRTRFTPCDLVTPAQARAIVGAPLAAPVEAPQGPTCIYREKSGDDLITLAVQSQRIATFKRLLRRPQQVDVGDKTAFCGKLGQPMLFVGLQGGRVLSVAAPCATARRFAAAAVERLGA
jgi:hypothetical protein